MSKPTIAIIGYTGMVGGSAYRYFKSKGHPVMGLTRSNQTHSWDEINEKADWIIVAVPTPFDWKTNEVNTMVLEATLAKIKPGKKVIHKCTVPPMITEMLQGKFPKLYLYFNPEFLSEATCDEDFTNPDRQIIGYASVEARKYAFEALHLFPQSPYDYVMTSTEAEICKFVNNFHGALMVIFSNFFHDVCERTGSNYEIVKGAGQASKWVGSPMGRMYWDVFHGGFRGYGGKCFPKDINMLLEWAGKNCINTEILGATKNANVRILEQQDLTEEQAEKISSRTEA